MNRAVRSHRRWTEEEKEALRTLPLDSKYAALALRLGRTTHACAGRAKAFGLPNRTERRRLWLRREVRRAWRRGLSDRAIGAALGVSDSTARCWRLKLGLHSHFGWGGKRTKGRPASSRTEVRS